MEPQTCFCIPNDDGGINLHLASQWFDLSHVAVSKCLKMPQSKIFGSFKRVGGGYGAKLSRASHIACACALACHLLRAPVRFVMNIESNMTVMGKRCSCAVEYDASVDSTTGHLITFAPTIASDLGSSKNDNITLFLAHTLGNSCYAHPTEWKMNLNVVNTDAPCTTWCRAPGTTEAIAIQENLMEHIARETNLDPAHVRLNNINPNSALHNIFPEFLKDVGKKTYPHFHDQLINLPKHVSQIILSVVQKSLNLISKIVGVKEELLYAVWHFQ